MENMRAAAGGATKVSLGFSELRAEFNALPRETRERIERRWAAAGRRSWNIARGKVNAVRLLQLHSRSRTATAARARTPRSRRLVRRSPSSRGSPAEPPRRPHSGASVALRERRAA